MTFITESPDLLALKQFGADALLPEPPLLWTIDKEKHHYLILKQEHPAKAGGKVQEDYFFCYNGLITVPSFELTLKTEANKLCYQWHLIGSLNSGQMLHSHPVLLAVDQHSVFSGHTFQPSEMGADYFEALALAFRTYKIACGFVENSQQGMVVETHMLLAPPTTEHKPSIF